ncbi:MAG: hypothetical protein ABH834_06625 [Candidatus Altiarchaeota archaeon]
MVDLGAAKEVLVQNPYNPVCLMTEIVAGTQYEQTLDLFRRFRDNVLIGKAGSAGFLMSKAYYDSGTFLAPCVRGSGFARRILLDVYRILYRVFSLLRRKGFF